jgi:hypothetical protein
MAQYWRQLRRLGIAYWCQDLFDGVLETTVTNFSALT